MSQTETSILAGGCFWGMQDLIRKLPGVISTRVGYSGGDVPNATYRNHGSHAEAIEVVFDPALLSFRALLELFFQIHDPTTPNRQGNDRGSSYRSAIYYSSEMQRAVAEDTIADVNASGLWPGKVVTEVCPAGPSLSIRIISNTIRAAIPATSRVASGSCRCGPVDRRSASHGDAFGGLFDAAVRGVKMHHEIGFIGWHQAFDAPFPDFFMQVVENHL